MTSLARKIPICLSLLYGLAALLWPRESLGQQVLWERTLRWGREDQLYDVVDLGDGTFLSSGTRRRFGGGTANTKAVTLLRITAWGDTVYCTSTGMEGTNAKLCRTGTGKVYVTSITSGPFAGPRHLLGRVDPETGLLAWQMTLPAFYNWAPGTFSFTEGPDESLLLCGGGTDSLGLASNVGFIARYDTLGSLLWATYVREHSSYTLLNHVEMTPRGTILASGTAGSRIFAIEFAPDGTELRRTTFYTTPTRIIFDVSASVRQAPGDRYLVSGTTQGSPTRVYLGMHQGWGGPALWGGETVGGLRNTVVLADTGAVYYHANATTLFLTRLKADSAISWSRAFINRPNQYNTILDDYVFLHDSSAIACGMQTFRDSTQEDFYLARITNMGVPYRPWSPVTAAKPKASQPAPRPYPNPCNYALHFTGLTGPATLSLHDPTGRSVLQTTLQPGQAAEVGALPPGVYGYVLQGPGKMWRGRVVKG